MSARENAAPTKILATWNEIVNEVGAASVNIDSAKFLNSDHDLDIYRESFMHVIVWHMCLKHMLSFRVAQCFCK